MAAPLLAFDRVAIHLGGREILSPTRFEVGRGEFVCIVGPSGCGKTTLLRAASGLVAPSGGTVRRNGQPMMQPSREVAFVFQDYGRALLPWRTVQGNVSLALEAAGVPPAERATRIDGVLAKVGLSAHAEKFPAQLPQHKSVWSKSNRDQHRAGNGHEIRRARSNSHQQVGLGREPGCQRRRDGPYL